MTDDSAPAPDRTCFVARPLSITPEVAAHYGGDDQHWEHVEKYLIVPALAATGYTHLPTPAKGANLIHEHVIRAIDDSDLVIADFSRLNANVLFEAGVRTSVNKPLVVIAEKGTRLPFDVAGTNTWFYDPALRHWDLEAMVAELTEHIEHTDPEGNALWRKFGVRLQAGQLAASSDGSDSLTAAMFEQLSNDLREMRSLMGLRSEGSSPSSPEHAAAAQIELEIYGSRLVRAVAVRQPDSRVVEAVDNIVVQLTTNSRLPIQQQRHLMMELATLLDSDFNQEFQDFSAAWRAVKTA